MQTRAIATAAARLKKEGLDPEPEIMIPLVSVLPELETLRAEVEAVIAEVCRGRGRGAGHSHRHDDRAARARP